MGISLQELLNNDSVKIIGYVISASTLLIWLTAIIGFVANIFHNRKLYATMSRENKLREIAKDAFLKAEKISKLTPIKGDDKLLEYLKYAIQAFKITFNSKPSQTELLQLKSQAATMAAEEKMYREPVAALARPAIMPKKAADKKPIKKLKGKKHGK